MGLEQFYSNLSVAKILYFMDLRPLERPKRLFWDVFSHVKRCWDCIRKKKLQALEISVSSLRVYKNIYDRVKTHGVGNYDLSWCQGQQSGKVKDTKVKATTNCSANAFFYFNERLHGVEEDKESKARLWKKRRRPLLAPPALLPPPSSLVL